MPSGNDNLSRLDWNQALKRTVDATNDTLRVAVITDASTGAMAMESEVEIDHLDGDSITIFRNLLVSATGSVIDTSSPNDVLLNLETLRHRSVSLYGTINDDIGMESATVKLQASVNGSEFADIPDSEISVSGSVGDTIMVGPINIVAFNVRTVVVSHSLTGGSVAFTVGALT